MVANPWKSLPRKGPYLLNVDQLVVVMRSGRLWEAAVPELRGYKRSFTLVNPWNPVLSPNNCPDGFPSILREIEKHRG